MSDWVLVSNDWGSESTNHRSTSSSSIKHVFDLSDSKLESLDERYPKQEITQRHWVKNEDRQYCANRQCRVKFTLIERQHHCRRCGEIFCNECLKYQRRLSNLAHLDPEGKLYKVCQTCFEEGRDSDYIQSNQLTPLFKHFKLQSKQKKAAEGHAKTSLIPSWRDKLDLSKECKRLQEGFMKTIGTSEMKRTLHEMKEMIRTPNWQKSANWIQESIAEKCQVCKVEFGFMKKKYTCKLCGQVLCKGCVRHELLVYIPDDENDNLRDEAKLVIIKVIGSPEAEPEISLLLHICMNCRQYVVDRQIDRVEQELRSEVKDTEKGVFSKLIKMDVTITTVQDKINTHLRKFQEIVESLEDDSRSSSGKNNIKVLAKSQEDLADYFSNLGLKIPTMKKLQEECETNTQRKLLRNYIKAKSDYYLNNMDTFRMAKKKLSESASPKDLEFIQNIVDKNAIVSAQIYIRQLVFESIHLCEKHKLRGIIPDFLRPIDDAIEKETETCLKSQGQDIEQHRENLMEIIKIQMKEHRVIKPSKRLLASEGHKHAADVLRTRTAEVLEQVKMQLDMKTSNRSFQRTKIELSSACEFAMQLKTDFLLK